MSTIRDLDGAITFMHRHHPWWEQRILDETFPEPLSAAEEMLGELAGDDHSRNAGRNSAGPAYSQLFFGEEYDDDPDLHG